MRILFYLPVVTPWWFEQVVEPLIRRVAAEAEVQVLAPAPWRNTGIGPEQLRRCADLPGVAWSIVDDADHPSLRTVPADRAGLIDYVHGLAPDLVFCRSADFDTPRAFPGIVRHLMEAVLAPFSLGARPNTIHCTDAPFENGAMPALSDGDAGRLEAMIAPFWDDMQAHWHAVTPDRATVYRAYGIPEDRPVMLLPLEYEHAENFFLQHRPGGGDATERVENAAAAARAAGVTLVVTDHPLNRRHVDRGPLEAVMARLGTAAILADASVAGIAPTAALLRHVDGAVLGDSKTFAMAAAFGTPTCRLSRFASAPWLHAEADLGCFLARLAAGTALRPDAAAVRRWFGYHYANEAFYPTDPALSGTMVIQRAMAPCDPARWLAGIGQLQRFGAAAEAAA